MRLPGETRRGRLRLHRRKRNHPGWLARDARRGRQPVPAGPARALSRARAGRTELAAGRLGTLQHRRARRHGRGRLPEATGALRAGAGSAQGISFPPRPGAPTTRPCHRTLCSQPTTTKAETCLRARAAATLAERRGIGPIIDQALATTAVLLARNTLAAGEPARHPLGFSLGPAGETCGTCAWRYLGGRGAAVERCRQSAPELGDGLRVHRTMAACDRWEQPVECGRCGACCREAYHTVSVSMRDPVVSKHPALVVRNGHRWSVLRDGDRCAALEIPGEGYRCQIYPDRPRTCREFEQGGRHCLVARRRVGLSQ